MGRRTPFHSRGLLLEDQSVEHARWDRRRHPGECLSVRHDPRSGRPNSRGYPERGTASRLRNLNMKGRLRGNSPERLSEALHRIYRSFPQTPKKGVLEATIAWLGSLRRRLIRRRRSRSDASRNDFRREPGRALRVPPAALRQSGAFEVREKIRARMSTLLDRREFAAKPTTRKRLRTRKSSLFVTISQQIQRRRWTLSLCPRSKR